MLLISVSLHATAASVFLIPILLVVNIDHTHNFRRALLYYLFALYLCIVYDLVGPPNITYMNWDPAVNWIPLIGMADDLRSSGLNVLMFVPLGAALPLMWKRFRNMMATVSFGFGLSAAIELSQLFTLRATDINDLITNTLGTIIGYLLAKQFFLKFKAENPISPAVLLILSCAVMFFGEPYVFNWLYSLI